MTNREAVRVLALAGLSGRQIAARLGLTPATVSYHRTRLGFAPVEKYARRYDWRAVQAHYDAGNSMRDCQAMFGFSSQTWHAAVKRGAIVPRRARPIHALLEAGAPRSRGNVKRRLLAEGLKIKACEECGISEWRGRPLGLALHHVNGDGNDNRLQNLQLLCPNCHSQTPNFGVRNRRRPRTGAEPAAAA